MVCSCTCTFTNYYYITLEIGWLQGKCLINNYLFFGKDLCKFSLFYPVCLAIDVSNFL